jgi:uncharacterized protein (UPF0548 family)
VPIVLGRPSDATLTRVAADAKLLDLSYREVGMTRRPSNPTDRYRWDGWSIDLGDDTQTFDRACEALRCWHAHRGAGARVVPADTPLTVGSTVVVALGFRAFTAIAPCRIVWTVDDEDNFGFGYGTLEGHPERGEESFVIHRQRGHVTFAITAASCPAGLIPRAGSPVTRMIQKRVTNHYLHALKRAVTSR